MTTKNIGLLGQSYPIITSAEAPLSINNGVISYSGSSGGVTSVGLVMPTGVFDVSNSPITSSGDITVTFDNQVQNLFFASPDGSTGQPSFRAIVPSDIPILNQNTSGNALTATSADSATNFTGSLTGDVTGHQGATSVATVGGAIAANIASAATLKHTQNTDTGTTQITFSVNSGGSKLILDSTGLTGNRTITFPDITDILVGRTATQTLTNKTLTSPTLTTPALGVATATSINGLTISTSTGTLTITNAKTLSISNSLTFAGTDGTTQTFQSSDTIVGRTTTDTLTNKTLTAPKIDSGGFIADANGNELLIFTTVASAVNEITYKNNSTGNNPTFTASGGDSNIGFTFTPKGSGNTVISTGTLTVGGYSYASGGSAGFGAGSYGQSFFIQDNSGNLCSIPSRRETIGKAADYTVTGYNDSNGVLHNNGAAGTIIMTLPSTPAIGNHYIFYVLTAQILRVKAGGANARIRLGASVSAANGTIESSTVGNSIHIHYIASNQWVVTAHEGTWIIT